MAGTAADTSVDLRGTAAGAAQCGMSGDSIYLQHSLHLAGPAMLYDCNCMIHRGRGTVMPTPLLSHGVVYPVWPVVVVASDTGTQS